MIEGCGFGANNAGLDEMLFSTAFNMDRHCSLLSQFREFYKQLYGYISGVIIFKTNYM